MDDKTRALQQYFGYSAFRGGQAELIDAQLSGRDVLGIMPTGGGKSLCYQIPALLSAGITFVVSPLISLMKDQVAALKRVGISAAYINSSLTQNQIWQVYRNLLAGQYKIAYIAPERLLSDGFLQTAAQLKISILAVDEAHCISQWGQDFRPSYLKIVEFLNTLPERPVVAAFTATATPQVREDIERALELRGPLRIVTGFDRPNLRFEVRCPKNKAGMLLQLVSERVQKSGIVYCSTRREVENICAMLQNNGISATRYHAGLDEKERHANQDAFIYDRCAVIVATNAFGMGIDKSNVSYVIHYNMPQSIEAYYQEAGRAGRDGADAECILLYAARDVQTAKYLIEHPNLDDEEEPADRRQVIERDLRRLKQMVGYCKTTKCLRGYLMGYFGEAHPAACGNCGNCSESLTEKDITTQAKMILSCVRRIHDRLGYDLGALTVARTLRGSKEKRVMELGLDRLTTYGLMPNTPREELRDMIDCLESKDYLQTNATTGAISLTERAGEVLFRGEAVTMPVRKPLTTAPKRSTAQQDEGLVSALKALRMKLAVAEHVPVYVVFSNATLEDMAKKRPMTKTELLSVSGIGDYKAAHYGDAVLAEIKRYLTENGEL